MAGLVPAIHVFSNGGRKSAVLLRTRHSLVARMERSDIRETFNPAEIESDSRISLSLNPGYARCTILLRSGIHPSALPAALTGPD